VVYDPIWLKKVMVSRYVVVFLRSGVKPGEDKTLSAEKILNEE